jgi:hypothetical protein
MDKLMRVALESSNIPSIVIKGEKQMEQESEQRAQQQQAQNAQEAALNASQIIKNTGMDSTNVCKSALIVSTPHIDIMLSNAILPSSVLKTLL